MFLNRFIQRINKKIIFPFNFEKLNFKNYYFFCAPTIVVGVAKISFNFDPVSSPDTIKACSVRYQCSNSYPEVNATS